MKYLKTYEELELDFNNIKEDDYILWKTAGNDFFIFKIGNLDDNGNLVLINCFNDLHGSITQSSGRDIEYKRPLEEFLSTHIKSIVYYSNNINDVLTKMKLMSEAKKYNI